MRNPIETVVALLQEAALGREPLSACLSAIGKLVNSDTGLLWAPGAAQAGTAPYYLDNLSAEQVEEYLANFFLQGRDPHLNAILTRTRFRAVNIGEELVPRKTFLRSDLYN